MLWPFSNIVEKSWIADARPTGRSSRRVAASRRKTLYYFSSALGQSLIKTLAEKTGMSEQDVTAQLSNILPAFVDKLTPQGRVPTHDEIARHDA